METRRHARALDAKDRANQLPRDSMAFARERDAFGSDRALAITGYTVGAAALGFAAWWWLGRDRDEPVVRTVGITADRDGALLTWGGRWP